MNIDISRIILRFRSAGLGLSTIVLAAGILISAPDARAQGSPKFKYDSSWPKLPLPNKWIFETVTGLFVDRDDIIWVLNRPRDYEQDKTENYASLSPPSAMCCLKPPSVMAFDTQGNLVHSWEGAQNGHTILVDKQGFVWIGSDTLRKYTKDGKLVSELPRIPEAKVPEGKYPPDTPLWVGTLEGGAFDDDAREMFLVDGYLNGRIMVYDMDTYKFKRGWGAYGKPLSEINRNPTEKYDPKVRAKDFLGHVTMGVSKDGLIYAADRHADRIQVFTKQGKFVKEFTVAPETLDRGSTGGQAFSADPQQRYLYVSDIMNNVVWIVNRADGTVLDHFGFFGHSGGGFQWLHMVAVDSKGNIYTGEVDTGKRIQRFLKVN